MRFSVVNVKGLKTPAERAGVIYVGRAFAGWPAHPLANPFRIYRPRADPMGPQWSATWDEQDEEKARAECLAKYRAWLDRHRDRDRLLAELLRQVEDTGKPLGCWCHPAPCHAGVLCERLERMVAARW